MKKRTDVKPAEAPQKPVVSDKPLIDRYEQERADRTLHTYFLDAEGLAAAQARCDAKNAFKHFAPTAQPIKLSVRGKRHA